MESTEITTGRSAGRGRPRLGPALRIAIVLVGTGAIWFSVVRLGPALLGPGPTMEVRLVNAAFTCVCGVTLVIVARHVLDRGTVEGLGLPLDRRAVRPFLSGLAAFLVPALCGLVVAASAGWVQLEPAVPAAELAGSLALVLVTVLAYEAVPEELIFRGYIYDNLESARGPWNAVVGQAVLFAIFGTTLWVATSGWGVLLERGALFLCLGLLLGGFRLITGSVWPCIGFHLGFQAVAQTVHGDGVEATGPVDVVAALPAFALGTVLVAALAGRTDQRAPAPRR